MTNFTDTDLILLTGASSGIGRETAIKLTELGARVIAVARNKDKLGELKSGLKNPDIFFVEPFDLSKDIDKIGEFIIEVVQKYGKISGFVHSAGALRVSTIKSEEIEEQRNLFNLNYFSAMEIIKTLTNKRYKAENLSVILMSSIAGLRGEAGLSTYSSTKGAIISGVRSLAKELGRFNIRVNAVSPGTVRTNIEQSNPDFFNDSYYEQIKQKWVLPNESKPEYVADLILFLLSQSSCWITGQNIVIDGGESL